MEQVKVKRVRFIKNACGYGFAYNEGQEGILLEEAAERAIKAGIAEEVKEEVETATKEKAVSKRSKEKR